MGSIYFILPALGTLTILYAGAIYRELRNEAKRARCVKIVSFNHGISF